ncbi:MAG: hypothetical protein ABF743_14280 [Schleiferilactobacillus perolens]|uniref:hypothetical protein n=1 Tax=Schleiferilactobacillus perolens TaxID=100468 RepID=UPI0039E81672
MKKGLLTSLAVAVALGAVGFAAGTVTNTFEAPAVVQAADKAAVYVVNPSADVYDAPNGNIIRSLPMGTAWLYYDKTNVNYVNWFRVGNSEWVKDTQVAEFVQSGSIHNERGVVVVEHDSAVWNSPNTSVDSYNVLQTGTRWQYYCVLTDVWGATWYNLGGSQWLSSRDVSVAN